MTTFTVETIDRQPAATVHAEVPMAEIRTLFDRGFAEVMRVAHAQGVAITGPPFGFYPRMPTDTVEVAVGFPVSTPVAPDGGVTPFELPGGRVVTGIHVGAYETRGDLPGAHRVGGSGGPFACRSHLGVLPHRPAGRAGPRHVADQDHLPARPTTAS